MNCPVDASTLRRLEQGGLAISACDLCHGVWLSHEALGACVRKGEKPAMPAARQALTSFQPRHTPRNCPACAPSLLLPRELHEIEVDICPKCRGIWLDAGELERIILRAKQQKSAGTHHDLFANLADGTVNALDVAELLNLLGEVVPRGVELGAEGAKAVAEFLVEAVSSIDL